MIKLLMGTGLIGLTLSSTAFADSYDNCEVVLMEPVLEDAKPTGKVIAAMHPATEFMTSIYDDQDGHLAEIDGQPIRAVLCQRQSIVPTARDFPVIATGLPFALSDNFDSPDSALLTVSFDDDAFTYKYLGANLDEADQAALTDVMEIFNLQDHNLATDKGKKQ